MKEDFVGLVFMSPTSRGPPQRRRKKKKSGREKKFLLVPPKGTNFGLLIGENSSPTSPTPRWISSFFNCLSNLSLPSSNTSSSPVSPPPRLPLFSFSDISKMADEVYDGAVGIDLGKSPSPPRPPPPNQPAARPSTWCELPRPARISLTFCNPETTAYTTVEPRD
jgi:hypothetical protein